MCVADDTFAGNVRRMVSAIRCSPRLLGNGAAMTISCRCATAGSNQRKPSMHPVILDTDIGNDIDDVLALTMLVNLHRRREITLKAVLCSKLETRSPVYADFLCKYLGVDVEIGYSAEAAVHHSKSNYLNLLGLFEERYGSIFPAARDYRRSDELLADQLSMCEDQTVVVISIGFPVSVAKLLNNKKNAELFNSKVRRFVIMAGRFSAGPPEFNASAAPGALEDCIVRTTCPKYFIDVELGRSVQFPEQEILSLRDSGRLDPVVLSYLSFRPHTYPRASWDLLAALCATDTGLEIFNTSTRGRVSVQSDGQTLFSEDSNGRCTILSLSAAGENTARTRLSDLIRNWV